MGQTKVSRCFVTVKHLCVVFRGNLQSFLIHFYHVTPASNISVFDNRVPTKSLDTTRDLELQTCSLSGHSSFGFLQGNKSTLLINVDHQGLRAFVCELSKTVKLM